MTKTSWATILLLLPLVPLRQQTSSPPVFHASTHLVQINVVVHDKSGHPVRALTKDDFAISDRGKPQTVSVFTMEAADIETASSQPLPANTFSDEARYRSQSPNAVTVILLDNLNTLSTTSANMFEDSPIWLESLALSRAKQNLLEFLGQLDSRQRIAIYGLSDTLHVLCDFTCTRDQLIAVVKSYDASSHTRREDVQPGTYRLPEPDCGGCSNISVYATRQAQQMAAMNNDRRAQVTMAALSAIAAHVADIPGRKNLLWLTGNLPFSGVAIAHVLGSANIAAYPVDARGLLPHETVENKEGNIDADAYVKGDLAKPEAHAQPAGVDTMQRMAEDTGGRAFVNTNDLTGAIRKAVEDAAVTYTLGFYVDAASLDNKFHELRVQVNRAGVTVRQPRGYFAAKDVPATEDERRRNFAVAIKSPLDSSAIPLTVKVDHVNQPKPDSLQIVASVALANLGLSESAGSRTGAVDVYVVEQDAAGNVLHQASNRMRLNLTAQQYEAYLKSGIGFREAVQPSPGATLLRVLVQDTNTSAVGSVVIPLAQVK